MPKAVTNDMQAIEIAKKAIRREFKKDFICEGAFEMRANSADAYWCVCFDSGAPEGFEPREIHVRINSKTGTTEIPPSI